MPCIFCDEPREAGEVIFEDEKVLVIAHKDWAVRGHAMIVWKTHVENVADLTPDEHAHFSAIHHRAERALLDATGANRAVLLKLGILTPHLHLHIYPVSAALDRTQVMAIIDARTLADISEEERRTFVSELRHRLS